MKPGQGGPSMAARLTHSVRKSSSWNSAAGDGEMYGAHDSHGFGHRLTPEQEAEECV